ncbi:MAG: hypothetical protein NZM44_07640 [Candidatus Calescibacterium sp.]|nr:hypothetical protein [Candidatus Calescibacterium sp.]
MTTQEYEKLAGLINYGIRLYRRFGMAYKIEDSYAPINSIEEYLDNANNSNIIYHFYQTVRKILKPTNNFDFVYEQPISNIFYAMNNYIKQNYGKPSLGIAAKDLISKHIHNIPSDYCKVHQILFNIEDEGYYRLYGWITNPVITLSGASGQYSNHNKYTFSFESNDFYSNLSVKPQNNKYWIEQSQLLFVCKNAVPNFYINTDVVTPSGVIVQNVYWQVQFGTRTITNINNFSKLSYQFVNNSFSSSYKVSNVITTSQSIPTGSKINIIKELHIPNTYTYTAGDFIICSGIASDMYTGNEVFSPDDLYQLPNVS